MNISADILAFLKLFGKASVPGFGKFSVEKTGALFHSETKTFLPPAQKIIFKKNNDTNEEGLVQFLSKRNHLAPEQVEHQLRDWVAMCESKLQTEQKILIPELGQFSIVNDQLIFEGERIEAENSDFFGLEEINLEDVQKPSSFRIPKKKQSGASTFGNIILWTFLVGIPIIGMLVLAFTQQDLLFGKKSFADQPIMNSTHRIKSTPITKDSVTKKKIDTLAQDSLKKKQTTTTPLKSQPHAK